MGGYFMERIIMNLQDERKAILCRYRQHEIESKDAIILLRKNDAKMKQARRGKLPAAAPAVK